MFCGASNFHITAREVTNVRGVIRRYRVYCPEDPFTNASVGMGSAADLAHDQTPSGMYTGRDSFSPDVSEAERNDEDGLNPIEGTIKPTKNLQASNADELKANNELEATAPVDEEGEGGTGDEISEHADSETGQIQFIDCAPSTARRASAPDNTRVVRVRVLPAVLSEDSHGISSYPPTHTASQSTIPADRYKTSHSRCAAMKTGSCTMGELDWRTAAPGGRERAKYESVADNGARDIHTSDQRNPSARTVLPLPVTVLTVPSLPAAASSLPALEMQSCFAPPGARWQICASARTCHRGTAISCSTSHTRPRARPQKRNPAVVARPAPRADITDPSPPKSHILSTSSAGHLPRPPPRPQCETTAAPELCRAKTRMQAHRSLSRTISRTFTPAPAAAAAP
ncbi:hypothetical protein DFH06DRAFT_1482612 [Mycena polygramma]|nr:hypothetical protein DFH06DRAFT_1482612 [Mycena polygramma]